MNCKTCEEVADILDRFYAPMCRLIDRDEKVSDSDLAPMHKCMAELMHIWFRLRPGSSNVGIVLAALEASNRRPQG